MARSAPTPASFYGKGIATATRRSGGRFVRHWVFLALTFAYLSLDESAYLHEILIEPLRNRLGTGGLLYFAWVIPGAAAVLIFGLAYLRFLWNLNRRSRFLFVAAGLVFVGGALGFELIGGALAESFGFESIRYTVIMTIEETLEMCGLILFVFALVDYLRRELGFTRLEFSSIETVHRSSFAASASR